LVLAGVGALVAATPCSAVIWPQPPAAEEAQGPAMRMLQSAALNSVMRPWSGVQRMVTTQGGMPRLSAIQVEHRPGEPSPLRVVASDQQAVPSGTHDAALLDVLDDHYDVVVAGDQLLKGRRTTMIEALRPGVTGPAAVGGRFWLDAATGMVLRRDVHDETGAVARTTTFDLVNVGEAAVAGLPATASAGALDQGWLDAMEAEGWPVIRELPSGLELFEARKHDSSGVAVLQLSYSDGLSTMSLFVQPGELATEPPGTARPVDGGGTVWVSGANPERLVWSADGRTWTLLSDAPQTAVEAALRVLPHAPRSVSDSPTARVWRGMSVLGGWLNPFR